MRLFAKRVRDPEVCFCQNVVEVINDLSQATTNVAWLAIAKRVLTERGLLDILVKHGDNIAGYIIEECYPSDRNTLMNHAEALCEIASGGLSLLENPPVLYALSRVLKKMGLYDSEKKALLKKYVYKGNVDDSLLNYMMQIFE